MTILGPYELQGEIGQGSFSRVFRARHRRTGNHVAIKLFTGIGEDGFVHELGVGFGVQHPNLLSARDVGYGADGARWVAFDLAYGGSLADRFGAQPCSISFARHVLVQVGRGLQALHDAGVVHRDVKPANILVEDSSAFARVRLADFGTSASVRKGAAMGDPGSPAYMAPEQAEGQGVGPASDAYGFAVVLYEMLVGRRPFLGGIHTVIRLHKEGVPNFEGLPSTVATILAKALSKEPADRYPSVRAFVAKLDGALAEVQRRTLPRGKSDETQRGRALAYDEGSGWAVVPVDETHVEVVGDGAPEEILVSSPGSHWAVDPSSVGRIACRDENSLVLGFVEGRTVLPAPLYGLPPRVLLRRLAGDVVTVEGASSPMVSIRDAKGTILSRRKAGPPVEAMRIVLDERGEHVLTLDVQKRVLSLFPFDLAAEPDVLDLETAVEFVGTTTDLETVEGRRISVAVRDGRHLEIRERT